MLEENMAIQKGKYEHITAFMDYAIVDGRIKLYGDAGLYGIRL